MLAGVIPVPHFIETASLSLAIALCAEWTAALSLYVFAPDPMLLDAGARHTDKGRMAALYKVRTDAERAACKLASRAGVSRISEHANLNSEHAEERFVHLARTNDLAILDAAPVSGSAGRRRIENVLFESGQPVLIQPPQIEPKVPRRIAIAWDGSARAARAARDALPLLAGASQIFIATVTGEKDLSRMAPGSDLAIYLARHGITQAELAMLARAEHDVAGKLLSFAGEEEVDAIVLGAFVHSRFRENVLGGVTRALLDHSPIPLFMSH